MAVEPLTKVVVEADAEQLRQVNEAEAERLCSVTVASLMETFVKVRAQATFDYASSMADAQYMYAWGDYSTYSTIKQQADQSKQGADRTANLGYAVGAAVATGKRDISYATASTTRVASSGGAGADITFLPSDGSVLLTREVKCIEGNYYSFNRALSWASKNQVRSAGEVWIQVRMGTNIQSWLARFRGTPGRCLDDYAGACCM